MLFITYYFFSYGHKPDNMENGAKNRICLILFSNILKNNLLFCTLFSDMSVFKPTEKRTSRHRKTRCTDLRYLFNLLF